MLSASWTSYLCSTRSRSIWRCLMTSAKPFTSYRHLCLTFIDHDRSCSWVVFVCSLVQMPVPMKPASSGKIPSNQPFPAGPFFAFAPRPTPTPLHSILLGFNFENIYFSKYNIAPAGRNGIFKKKNLVLLGRNKPHENMSNWKNHL